MSQPVPPPVTWCYQARRLALSDFPIFSVVEGSKCLKENSNHQPHCCDVMVRVVYELHLPDLIMRINSFLNFFINW